MIVPALAIGWIAGLLLGANEVSPLVLLGPLVVVALVAIRFRGFSPLFWTSLALGAAVLGDLRLGAFWDAVQSNAVAGYTRRSVVQLRGAVVEDPVAVGAGSDLILEVRAIEQSGEWTPASGQIQVRSAETLPYRVGDRLELAGVLLPPDPQLPPYESPLRQEGVVAVASYPRLTPLEGRETDPLTFLARVREDAAAVLNRALPEPEAGLARGITLGERGTLGPELSADFSRTNTSHILAVDGYKVGLVTGLIESLLHRALGIALRTVGTVGGIALYTVFVGASPSALRAAIMGGIFAVGRALGRPRDTLNGLAIAALVMTASNPFLLWNLAFQLSFTTTLGLAALAPLTEGWIPRRLGALREAIGATLAAEVASAPLVVAAFDHLSLTSLPVHAVVMPILPLAIGLSALTATLGLLAPIVGDAAGLLAWVPLAGIVTTVQWAGELPLAALPIPRLGLTAVLAIYAALGLAVFTRPNPLFGPGLPVASLWRRAIGVVPARVLGPGVAVPAILLGAIGLHGARSVDRIAFLDVAGGDAALIQLATGSALYLQDEARADRVARAADPFLPFWDRSIELAALSAGDDAGLTDLSSLVGRLAIRRAMIPAEGFSPVAVDRWQEAVARRQVEVLPVPLTEGRGPTATLGASARLAGYPLTGVPKQGRAAARAPSLAFRLEVGRAVVLWASALPADQARLVQSGVPLSAQVLKLVGRAPRWGLDPHFFAAVNPSVVILSAGAADRYARPTPGTLDLLATRQVYRTDLDGTVVVAVEPNGLVVEAERGR